MDILKNHPAIKLGQWLKGERQRRGIVKRVFAGQILLTPAEYTELEAGVFRWLGDAQRRLVATILNLNELELKRFNQMCEAAQKSLALSFSNLFTREELEPVRFRFDNQSRKPGDFEKETILNAVFADIG